MIALALGAFVAGGALVFLLVLVAARRRHRRAVARAKEYRRRLKQREHYEHALRVQRLRIVAGGLPRHADSSATPLVADHTADAAVSGGAASESSRLLTGGRE